MAQLLKEAVNAATTEESVLAALHAAVKAGDRAPLVIGLAFLPAAVDIVGGLAVAPDRGSRWLNLAWLPTGHFPEPGDRWYAELRHATVAGGVPSLAPGGVAASWPAADFSDDADDRLCTTALDLRWAVLTGGILGRERWAHLRSALAAFLGDPAGEPLRGRRKFRAWLKWFEKSRGRTPTREERIANALVAGGDWTHPARAVERPEDFLPRPLLAFPEGGPGAADPWEAVTWPGPAGRVVPATVVDGLLAEAAGGHLDLVVPFTGCLEGIEERRHRRGRREYRATFRTHGEGRRELTVAVNAELTAAPGDTLLLGESMGREPLELPADFRQLTRQAKVEACAAAAGLTIEELCRRWFERRQLGFKQGVRHVDLRLAASGAKHSAPQQLYWDVSPCGDYLNADTEAFVLPPLVQGDPLRFTWTFGDLRVDLTPADPDFTAEPARGPDGKARKRKHRAGRGRRRRGVVAAAELPPAKAVSDELLDETFNGNDADLTDEELLPDNLKPRTDRPVLACTVFTGSPHFPSCTDEILDHRINGNRRATAGLVEAS